MSEYDELRTQIDELAEEIARVESNPSPWLSWITLLLSRLEAQAMSVDPYYQELYEDMLANLRDAIKNRLRTGGW